MKDFKISRFRALRVVFIFVVVLFLTGRDAYAQPITVSGKVIDNQTSEPLPFASVFIKHSPHGTIANAEGKFSIPIYPKQLDDTLQISMLGYTSWQHPVRQITTGGPATIALKPAAQYLPAFVVSDSLTAQKILRRTFERIRENYPFTGFQFDGFYREIQKADGNYISMIEAVATIYSKGFKSKHREKIRLSQLRRSLALTNPYVPFWDNKNLLWHLVTSNFVKDYSKYLVKYSRAFREENTSIDGVPVFVIVHEETPGTWLNTLYIRCDNYAIIRTEQNYNRDTDPERSWVVEGNQLARAYAVSKKFSVDFKPYNGKYYPGNYLMELHIRYKDSITGKDLLDFEIRQQFVSTDLSVAKLEIPQGEMLKEHESLKNIPVLYDSSFWKNHAIIRETTLDSIIRSELKNKGALKKD